MCVVEPRFPHLAMQDRDPVPGPDPAGGTSLPAGKNPLSLPQPPLRRPAEARVRDYLTAGGDGQAG